jgi:hypothetical protein
MPFTHPNARSVWFSIEFDENNTSAVLTIETDLKMNFEDPAYDKAKLDGLIDAAGDYASESQGRVDMVRIVPIR